MRPPRPTSLCQRTSQPLWHITALLSLPAVLFLACRGPTQPQGLPQPLRGKITLEHQQEHSWITLILTGFNTITVHTASDGSYTLPTLTDGLWFLSIIYPYYDVIADTLLIRKGRATRFTGERMLTQALQLQTQTNRTTYVLGDTVAVSVITRNLTTHSVTLVLPSMPAQYYVIRQGSQTIAQSGSFLPAVSEITFLPGETVTVRVPAPWVPGQYPEQSPVAPGTYTVFALWGPPVRCEQLYNPNDSYFTHPPECSSAAEALLRTVSPTTITLMTSP